MVCLLLGSGGSLVVKAVNTQSGSLVDFSINRFTANGGTIIKYTGSDNYYISCPSGGIVTAWLPLGASASSGDALALSGGLYLWGATEALVAVGIANIKDGKMIDFEIIKDFYFTANGIYQMGDLSFKIPDGYSSPAIYFSYLGIKEFALTSMKLVDNSTDKGILNSIKEGFAKLWEWLKGIWDSIKEIPTKIAASLSALGDRIKDFFSSLGDRIGNFFTDLWERIKAFFLPSDGFFDRYSASFKQFVSDHFGFLADFPDELSLLFNTVVSFQPADPPYIDFPEIKVPMPGKTYTILSRQRYTFDFLGNQPWSTLYSAYQAFVWLAYCLMLINLIRRKYAVVFGGSANAD